MKTTITKTTVKKTAPKNAAKTIVKPKSALKNVAKAPAKVSVKVAVKAPLKAPAKVAAKAVTKTSAKSAATSKLVKPALKTSAKPALKTLTAKKSVIAAVKLAPKKTAKAAINSSQKTTSKLSAKGVSKPVSSTKSTLKPVSKTPQNLSKTSKTVVQLRGKALATSDSKSAIVHVKKIAEGARKELPKVIEKSTKAEKINTVAGQASAPVSPAVTKAKSSRLASLTVPSMAQSVASTAAKASFGPVVKAPMVFAPAPFVVKHNPKLANNWKSKSAEELSPEEVLSMPATEYMNIKQMMFFKLRLIELKKGILESAGATGEHLRDDSAVVPDPTDRATIEEEHAIELRTRDRERKLLKKIEQSIARIDAGDYGYCDETGEAIGVGRLLARPTATLSLEAQQRRELKQKMYGD